MNYYIIFLLVLINCFKFNHCHNTDEKNAITLRFSQEMNEAGDTYEYSFETSNGISIQQFGSPNVTTGTYKYTDPNGDEKLVDYYADHNGYQSFAKHNPVAPEIPPYIIRMLEYLAKHAPPLEDQEQQILEERRLRKLAKENRNAKRKVLMEI